MKKATPQKRQNAATLSGANAKPQSRHYGRKLERSVSAAMLASAIIAGSAFAATDVVDPGLIVSGTQDYDGITLKSGAITPGVIQPAVINSTGDYDLRSGVVNDVNLSGAVNLTKSTSDDTVELNSVNTYTGSTTISRGTLSLGAGIENVLPTGTVVTVKSKDNSTLEINGNNVIVQGLNLKQGNLTDSVGTGSIESATDVNVTKGNVDVVLTGSAGLNKTGFGIFNDVVATLNKKNTYTGATTVSGLRSVLRTGVEDAISRESAVIVKDLGTLDLDGKDQHIASLTGGTSGNILSAGFVNLGSATLTTGYDNSSTEFYGVIFGSGGLTKVGTGTFTLSGLNTYTGATTINEGTLSLGNALALSLSTDVIVDGDTAVFDINGKINAAHSVTLINGTIDDLAGGGQLLSFTDFDVRKGTVNAVLGDALGSSVGLTKSVDGESVTLNAVNTYTGLTSVTGGTLVAGIDDAIAASSGLEVSGTNAVFDVNGTSQTVNAVHLVNGVIGDSSEEQTGTLNSLSHVEAENGRIEVALVGDNGLTKTTGGEVILSGANTYAGRTRVEEGTLKFEGDDVASINSAVWVWSNGTLDINDTHQEIASLGGRGNVLLGDSGEGHLDLGDNDASTTFSGVISGDGEVHKYGTGTWTLSGSNTFTGELGIFEGEVRAGNVNVLSNQIHVSVDDGATFNLDDYSQAIGSLEGEEGSSVKLGTSSDTVLEVGYNNDYTEFDGVISGAGNLTKVGSGELDLSGDNTFTGDTTILGTGGIFLTGGSLAGNVDVVSGYFGGNGIVHGNLWNNSVVYVGSGESDFTLGVGGNYVQTKNGTLYTAIASKSVSSLLAVDGQASLKGKLVLANFGYRPKVGEKYTILTAVDGVQGKFKKFVNPFDQGTLRELAPVYKSNSVVLEYVQESFTSVPDLTPNQKAVAKAVDKIVDHKKAQKLIDTLDSFKVSEVADQLSLLSPEQFAAIFNIGFATAQTQFINIERRLEDVRNGATGFSANGLALSNSRGSLNYDGMPINRNNDGLTLAGFDGKSIVGKQVVAPVVETSRWGFFATGSGLFGDLETTADARGSEFTTGGVTIGADYRVNNNLVVGLSAGYANTGSDLWNDGDIEVNSGRGGLYATFFNEGFYVNGSVNGAYNAYDTKRGTIGGIARGDTEGGEFNALLGGGYDVRVGGFKVGPVASVQYTYIGLNGFTETGSDAPLNINSQNQDSLKTTVGLKASYVFNVCGLAVTPEVRAQWQHEYLDSTSSIESSFAAGGGAFTVNGPEIGRDSLLLDAGASVQVSRGVSVFAYYTGEIGRDNYGSNSVNGGFRISF